jgi:hypothetical protein
MLGAKYDFSRDRERRAGVDDMVNDENNIFFLMINLFFNSGIHVKKH